MSLFDFGNAKTTKGLRFGWRTAIMYLAPASVSGVINTCEHSTAECRLLCLNTAGLAGVFKSIQESRIKKTRWMVKDPAGFWATVDREILNHENLTHRMSTRLKRKLKPCVRLNGTSDLWNTDIQTIMYRHPDVQFYDYTKDFSRIVDWTMDKMPMNYHLTYSYAGRNTNNAMWCLDNGVNVAVVFDVKRGGELPSHHWGYEVIDGDKHDLRFKDKRQISGCIIGLRAKGKAVGVVAHEQSFIQPSTEVLS